MPVVEFVHGCLYFLVVDVGKIAILGKVLPHQTIRVFIRTLLQIGIWIKKK